MNITKAITMEEFNKMMENPDCEPTYKLLTDDWGKLLQYATSIPKHISKKEWEEMLQSLL